MIAKERDPVPDFMKGMAVVFMIQVHLMELFARPEIFNSLAGKISLFMGGPPAAPVFMAVMGFYLAASSRSVLAKIVRGVKILILGFLLNTGLNMNLFIHNFKGVYSIDPLQYLLGVDILFLAGLSIMIITGLALIFKRSPWPYLALAFAVTLFSSILNDVSPVTSSWKYLDAFFRGPYEWSYFPLFPWLAYPLAGYAVYLIIEKKRRLPGWMVRYRLWLLLPGVVALGATSKFVFNITTDLPTYYHHGFLFFLWTLLFLGWWWLVISTFFSYFNALQFTGLVRNLGKEVTAAYVIQWLIIGNIATSVYKTQYGLQLSLWFTGITIATFLLVKVYRNLVRLSLKP